jgi:hypothetical protein
MSNWSIAAQYVDMMFYPGSSTYNAAVRAGGLKTTAYIDPNLCSGSYSVGANNGAGPNCGSLSSDAFYAQPGNASNALTVSYNNQITQKFGNPASPTLQAAAAAAFNGVNSSQGPFDYVEIDDAGTPDEYAPWIGAMCWGLGSFVNGSYSCSGSAGSATSPWGGAYGVSQWQNGEAALAAQMGAQVIFNGLGDNDAHGETSAAITPVASSASNVFGAMCETCFYGQPGSDNPWLHSSTALNLELTGIMSVINAGRSVMIVNNDVLDTNRRAQALADMMLAYDPDRMWQNTSDCGATSHIRACAEQSLTFYQPLKSYPTSTSSLTTSTGAYAREFGACYNRGTLIGPCATVVNPQPTSTVSMPVLSRTYGHTLVISGTGPCNCYGDTGSVAFTGSAAPSSLPAASGYVLFP